MTDRLTLPAATRLAALVVAAICTLTILAGVDQLARIDAAAPQMAQSNVDRGI